MGIEQELVRLILQFSTKTEDLNYYTEMKGLVEKLAYSLGEPDVIKKLNKLTTNVLVKCNKKGIVFVDEKFDTLNEVECLYYRYMNLKQLDKATKVKNVLIAIDREIGFIFMDLAKDDRIGDILLFPTVQDNIKPLEVT